MMLVTNLLRRLIHELGSGRALENACHEVHTTEWTLAVVDALAERVAVASTTLSLVDELVAA
jgi:hypothetical protein